MNAIRLFGLFGILRSIKHLFPSSHYALLSLFFFAGLELLLVFHAWLFVWIGALLVILFMGIALIKVEEGSGFHISQVILPSLAAGGFSAFGLFLPSTIWLHVYFAVCALIFFYILKHGAKQAWPTWNWVISLFVLFASVAALLGWRYYVYAPIVIVIGALALIVVLIAFQSLRRYTATSQEAWLLSLSMAFVIGEITWVLQFLPLHYIVETGIVSAVYYIMFRLIISTIEDGVLEAREIVEHAVVGVSALAMLLITAQWI